MNDSEREHSLTAIPDANGDDPAPFVDSIHLAHYVQPLATGPLQRARALALVSADRGEGTSTCTLQLGRYLAARPRTRVLLVDANLHHPSLHTLASVERTRGLSNLLFGDIELEDAVRATSVQNLFLLPSGDPVADAHEGLTTAALDERLTAQLNSYNFVLFDCPPVNDYVEATTIAAMCDGVILVVEGGKTRRQTAQNAMRLLQQARCKMLGALMNKRKFYVPQFIYDRL